MSVERKECPGTLLKAHSLLRVSFSVVCIVLTGCFTIQAPVVVCAWNRDERRLLLACEGGSVVSVFNNWLFSF